MQVQVIGIDCATEDTKIGLATGSWRGAQLYVERALLCTRKEAAATTVADWLRNTKVPTLLAVDAPLGWPVSMGRLLGTHRAGEVIAEMADGFFRRQTDRFIKQAIGKTPLDVGADRIGRTAHATLRLLDQLRRSIEAPIPLAWTPALADRVSAIEVYPAATLASHRFKSDRYKKPDQVVEREGILRQLETVIHLPSDTSVLRQSADALDAVVCLLAGADFLAGRAIPPDEPALALIEGWIWAQAPTARA